MAGALRDGRQLAGCPDAANYTARAELTFTKPMATCSFSRSIHVTRSTLARTHLTAKETDGTFHAEEGSVNCGTGRCGGNGQCCDAMRRHAVRATETRAEGGRRGDRPFIHRRVHAPLCARVCVRASVACELVRRALTVGSPVVACCEPAIVISVATSMLRPTVDDANLGMDGCVYAYARDRLRYMLSQVGARKH